MKPMRKSFITLFLQLIMITGFSQTTGIGQWRDHLPYNNCISVKEVGSRIYCATQYSVFYYDKTDNSIQRINKVNGLSDIGISSMNYSPEYHTLVVAYTNANIDLIKNNTIINISDIKRSSILGNKIINDIYFVGPFAYLSCGFGIVVLDVNKEEIHDTYYIGNNGSQVNVLGVTRDDQDTLYAATAAGLYTAWAKSSNLANFQSWKKDTRLVQGLLYDHIITFNGQVVVSQYHTAAKKDTLYRHSDGKWVKWVVNFSNPVSHFESTYGNLVISCNYFVKYFDQDFNLINGYYSYEGTTPNPSDAVFDNTGLIWISDKSAGLVSLDKNGIFTSYGLSGPLSSLVWSISASGNDVYIVPGGWAGYTPNYQMSAVYKFDGAGWNNYSPFEDPVMGSIWDLISVSVDPSDPRRIFAGSFTRGLLEFYDGKVVTHYMEYNSTLKHYFLDPDTSDIRVGGTAFDSDGNLWVVEAGNSQCLSRYCQTCNPKWTGYNVPVVSQDDMGQMVIDHSNQKWAVMRVQTSINGSLLVFKEDPSAPSGSRAKALNQQPGNGNIPGQTIYAIAVDKNGQVWVGTEKGIGVFFNPENVFSDVNFDAQQILVQQGAYVQYLMENEKVTAIAIDGANRKWIGSEGGGLYLFSEDGTKQINHFTSDNSPLISNNILALGINPETGEVFIGTDQGLVSYRGTATEGDESFSCTYAYPNPVKEDYAGLIGIKCLVTNAQVRITDVEGNLIYTTRAEGGEAVWDGKNFDGRKAKTGVYLVYASNDTGSEKIVTKILIIH